MTRESEADTGPIGDSQTGAGDPFSETANLSIPRSSDEPKTGSSIAAIQPTTESARGESSRRVTVELPQGSRYAGPVPQLEHELVKLVQFQHRGIIGVQELARSTTGWMIEFAPLPAQSLTRLSADWQRTKRPWRQATEFMVELADILAAAHAVGVRHGALCPEVILLTDAGRPLIADFGLGLFGSVCRIDGAMTAHSGYGPCSAPEQVFAWRVPVDARSDVYALGVILYGLLCSRSPIRASDPDELRRAIREDAPQPPRQLAHGIPPALERLCLRMLSKEPVARPANAEALARELRQVLIDTEAFDQPADQSGSTIAVRQAVVHPRENELLLLWTWDVSAFQKPQSDTELKRLNRFLRDAATAHQGTVFEPTDATIAVRLPVIGQGEIGLRELLECAMTMLARTKFAKAEIGFSIRTAELAGANPTRSSTTEFHGLKRVALRLSGRVSEAGILFNRESMELLRRWLPCRSRPNSEGEFEVTLSGTYLRSGQLNAESQNRDGCNASAVVLRVSPAVPEEARSPLAGRAAQLAMLKSRWEQTCEGMGQIVLLIGDEGSGKTRLVQELSDLVSATSDPSRWIRWSCLPSSAGQSFHPATEFFREAISSAAIGDSVAALRGYLDRWSSATGELLARFASLLQLRSADASPDIETQRAEFEQLTAAQRRDRWQQSLLDWLKNVAASTPVIFVVEDLQWVDPATLTLLQSLVDQGLNERVLTILAFRPEFETPWGSRAHQTQVALSRFTKRNAISVFSAVSEFSDPPQNVIEHLMEATEGVPLFVEEFARSYRRGNSPGSVPRLPFPQL